MLGVVDGGGLFECLRERKRRCWGMRVLLIMRTSGSDGYGGLRWTYGGYDGCYEGWIRRSEGIFEASIAGVGRNPRILLRARRHGYGWIFAPRKQDMEKSTASKFPSDIAGTTVVTASCFVVFIVTASHTPFEHMRSSPSPHGLNVYR